MVNGRPSIITPLDIFAIGQEKVFSYYLGQTIKEGDVICNPLRNDKRPSLSFYRNKKNILLAHDFTGWFYGDCINIVMKIYNMSFVDAMYKIWRDLEGYKIQHQLNNIKDSLSIANKIEHKTIITNYCIPHIKESINYWKEYGISIATLELYKVKLIKTCFVNDKQVYSFNKKNLAFSYDFGESCKVYMPKNKIRYITNSSAIQGFNQLKFNSNVLIITKSLKDVMCLHEFGYEAIAPQSEVLLLPKTIMNYLHNQYDKIFVFFDWDYTGICGMNKYKRLYNCIPVYLKNEGAKDISDYVKQKGKKEAWKLLQHKIK